MVAKKSARLLRAEQVWIDYNALGVNGEHSMAGAEYAQAKITNGTAPLTAEAVDVMAEEVRKRVERRDALERYSAAEQARYAAEADAQRFIHAEKLRLMAVSALERPLDPPGPGPLWSDTQIDSMSRQAQAGAKELFGRTMDAKRFVSDAAHMDGAVEACPSPAEVAQESLERHEDAWAHTMELPTSPAAVEERLAMFSSVTALLHTYYAPFSVDKGPALLRMTGDDIPSPARILDVIRGYITGEPN